MDLPPPSRRRTAFTLVEMLVSVAVLALLLAILTQLISGLNGAIGQTTNEIQQFQQARDAFETMTRRISQATLNAYDDRDPLLTTTSGSNAYVRASELRFISGPASPATVPSGTLPLFSGGTAPHPTHAIFFQAPIGYTTNSSYTPLIKLLNTCGYYIEWNSDQSLRPAFLPGSIPLRWRYRLMELIEPSENLTIYNYTSGSKTYGTAAASVSWSYYSAGTKGLAWFQNALPAAAASGGTENPAPVHAIAENVICLVLLPMLAPQNAAQPTSGAPDGTSTDLAPNYFYDTSPSQSANYPGPAQNRLPPMVYVMMIAVDEKSFSRFQSLQPTPSNDPSKTFHLSGSGQYGAVLTNASYAARMQDPTNSDIPTITAALTNAHIQYRIFSTAVQLSPN